MYKQKCRANTHAVALMAMREPRQYSSANDVRSPLITMKVLRKDRRYPQTRQMPKPISRCWNVREGHIAHISFASVGSCFFKPRQAFYWVGLGWVGVGMAGTRGGYIAHITFACVGS